MTKDKFKSLVETMKMLRSENGCPWDKEQTHESLVKHLREEVEELVENIQEKKYAKELKEELGDILLQVIFHSQIAEEDERFDIYDVAESLENKLRFRHPHVFGDKKAETTEDVARIWQEMKKKEKLK